MIKRIKLINWRSHKSTELEFERGSNVLVGKMGAGKSSVINAICFALFGTFPELQRREATLSNIITDRPTKQNFAKVELEFIHNNDVYRVERVIYAGNKTNEAKLYKNNRLIAGPKVSDVNKRIEEILEIDYELFSRAVYSEQNQIDYFLKLNPSERKTKFDELLDIERYEKVRKNAVTLRNSLRALLESQRGILNEQKKSFSTEELSKLQEELTKLNEEIKLREAELKEHEEKLRDAEKRLSELTKKQEEYRKLNNAMLQLKGSIATLKEQLTKIFEELGKEVKANEKELAEQAKRDAEKKLSELEEKEKELKELQASIRELKAKISQIEEENSSIIARLRIKLSYEKISEELKRIEAKLAELIKEKEKNEEIRKAYEKELTEVRKKIAVERSKIAELKVRLEEMEKAKALCPLCKRKLTEEHKEKLLKEFKSSIASSSANIKNFEESEKRLLENIEELSKKKEALEKNYNEILEIKMTIINTKQALERVEENKKRLQEFSVKLKELEEQESRLASLPDEIKKAQAELERANKELEAIAKIATLNSNEQKLASLEKALRELAFDEQKVREASAELEKTRGSIKTLEEKIAGLRALIKEKDSRLAELKRKKELIESLETDIKHLENLVEKLGIFINALKATQSELRENLIESINQAMAELWPKIYPYGDYTALKLRAAETYDLLVKSGSRWLAVEGTLSGGERSAAALTLRIAFSLVLARNLSMLILDEPTHNLDERTVSVLADMIKNVLPGLVEQIFLITHNKEMEKAASGTLYRLDRDKSTDGITRVELLSIKD